MLFHLLGSEQTMQYDFVITVSSLRLGMYKHAARSPPRNVLYSKRLQRLFVARQTTAVDRHCT